MRQKGKKKKNPKLSHGKYIRLQGKLFVLCMRTSPNTPCFICWDNARLSHHLNRNEVTESSRHHLTHWIKTKHITSRLFLLATLRNSIRICSWAAWDSCKIINKDVQLFHSTRNKHSYTAHSYIHLAKKQLSFRDEDKKTDY